MLFIMKTKLGLCMDRALGDFDYITIFIFIVTLFFYFLFDSFNVNDTEQRFNFIVTSIVQSAVISLSAYIFFKNVYPRLIKFKKRVLIIIVILTLFTAFSALLLYLLRVVIYKLENALAFEYLLQELINAHIFMMLSAPVYFMGYYLISANVCLVK